MRPRTWFLVVAALAAAGALNAQQKIGIGLGVGGEWITIPGRLDRLPLTRSRELSCLS